MGGRSWTSPRRPAWPSRGIDLDGHDEARGATLASWHDTSATQAIVEFVERVTRDGSRDYAPPPERIAVFDNDGTLGCEKPIQIEIGFILKRLAEMAEADASLQVRQP